MSCVCRPRSRASSATPASASSTSSSSAAAPAAPMAARTARPARRQEGADPRGRATTTSPASTIRRPACRSRSSATTSSSSSVRGFIDQDPLLEPRTFRSQRAATPPRSPSDVNILPPHRRRRGRARRHEVPALQRGRLPHRVGAAATACASPAPTSRLAAHLRRARAVLRRGGAPHRRAGPAPAPIRSRRGAAATYPMPPGVPMYVGQAAQRRRARRRRLPPVPATRRDQLAARTAAGRRASTAASAAATAARTTRRARRR